MLDLNKKGNFSLNDSPEQSQIICMNNIIDCQTQLIAQLKTEILELKKEKT